MSDKSSHRQLQVRPPQNGTTLEKFVADATAIAKAKAKSLEVELKVIKPRETQALFDELWARARDGSL